MGIASLTVSPRGARRPAAPCPRPQDEAVSWRRAGGRLVARSGARWPPGNMPGGDQCRLGNGIRWRSSAMVIGPSNSLRASSRKRDASG